MSRMIVLCGEISRSNNYKDSNYSNHFSNSKDVIINVTKVVVRKYILMKTGRVRAASSFR
jgi:hypothetical protein